MLLQQSCVHDGWCSFFVYSTRIFVQQVLICPQCISLQTAKCCNGLTIHGYELNPTSAALAQANAEACNLDNTYQVSRVLQAMTHCLGFGGRGFTYGAG